MENKSNSLNRIKRQQREKVLRFSIRKYSFGAASVAVAALMFLGARVASADSVVENTPKSAAGVVNPKDKVDSPVDVAESTENKVDAGNQALTTTAPSAPTVDKTKLRKVVEELNSLLSTKLNLDDSVVSPVKDRLQKGKEALENSDLAQKDIDELVELLSKDVTVVSAAAKESSEVQVDKTEKQADNLASQPSSEVRASEENQTVSAKKDSLKVSVDQLKAAVLELPAHETSKEVLEKANELLGLAQGVLQNTTVSLTDVEQMNKLVKRMFNSVKNASLRLTSGSHDSRNGQSMGQGTGLRSVPIDKDKKRGQLGIVVADSGFITGYATPSSTIQIKKNGQTLVTSTLDDSGQFKLNAPGIKVGDTVTLVVNGTTVATEVVSEGHTVSFNDSLTYVKQVDGYTAAESDVEITVGGQKYKTKSQSNGYFTVDVDPNLMVVGAEVTAVVTKDGKVVGRGTSIVRATKVTDFGVGWTENPMIDYSHRDVFSPDTKQYAFVSKGKANQAYDNIRVYREMRIEENGSKYYYWIVDSGPAANAQAGLSKKISLAIPRTVGDPYDFTYTQIKKGKQESYKKYPTASAWEYDHSLFRAYVKDGEKRSGSTYPENADAWMDYIEPSNGWRKDIYRKNSGDGTEPNADAFPRVLDMLGIKKGGLEYNLVRGVIEDKMNVTAGNRTIMTFKTKVLEGDELDQSIMSDWGKKDKSNPMLSEIKSRLANDPYLAYGGYTLGGRPRYYEGQNAIIGTLPLGPGEATNFNFQPVSKEQTTKVGVVPDAIKSIGNTDKLPKGTTYRWFKDPDVSKVTEPGKPVHGTVEVVTPQRGKFLVDAAVHVIDDKPQTPVATAKDNGDVTGKPQDPAKVDKITVSYTGEDNQPKTAVGKKDPKGNWTVDKPEVQINPNTGEITIPENKVKDGTEVTVVTKNGNGPDSDQAKATAKDVQKPTLTITPSNQTVVEGEKVEFTVTAKDNTSVTLNATDFLNKYLGRVNAGKATYTPVKTTETEKVVRISITTSAEDIGKQNTITFNAADNDGNNADPVNFNFTVTPRDTTPPKIYWLKDDGTRQELGYTHAAGQNVVIPLYRGDAVNTRLITIDDSGKVTNFRLENLQSGFSFTPVSGTATEESPLGQNVTGKVGLEVKKGKYTARAISTDGTNSTTGYFVFDIHEQAEKYPLEGKTETVTVGDSLKTWNGRVDSNQYTEASKGRGVGVEWGWKGEAPKVVQDTAGVFKYTATATHPDKSVAESNPQVTIIVKPKAPTIETDLTGKAEVPNTEVVVNVHEGVKDGSIVTLYSPEGRAIGTGTVTNGKAKITGTIPVGNITAKTTVQTPGQPNVESEPSPIKVATKIAETEKPVEIEITPQPNGDAIVTPKKPGGGTYPPGTKVEIPGENGPITVEIGKDGSGKVPNDKLPKKDVPGTGTVTEPNKKPSQPVNVTTPARKTPTIELKPDPKTGDVTVTPQRPGGGTYPPGTTVEIPGENGPITVEIGKDGSGKVPNDNLPKKDVPGTAKITEPGKPAVEVPNVTTPAKVTPATPETEKPVEIEITPQPNGDAIVTPKKPGGGTYPPGTKVEIPGENGPITVEIGKDGSGKVPNDKLPKKDVPGTGTVTEPNKKPSQPVNVTTPARKTPTIELKPDPKTGDVTVTPQRPGGGTYPPGTTVEIPGENGPITVEIGKDGSGKVPNDKLPKKDVPGTAKITEPGKPAVEVPNVTTPAKVTPATPETEKPVEIEITPQPNGDAIVTPKKPGGGTYPPGTKVEIPGENGPITVEIGKDGSGKVPNDKLPKKDVPGTGTVTEPNKKPSQPVNVTTPARKTPTIELKPDPKTGDVTVTPQRPGGGTYPPGTTVEIPGENGPITVEIGKDGSGKVPNDNLPKKDVPGTAKITEPGKPAVEVPNVTTPAKVTPATPETEKPVEIEITPQPNGDAIVTPKKPGGGTYPPGTKVEIPGENGPITVEIGKDGSGKVPNDKLPKKDVPGTGTVTEPNKKPSQPVNVTTPARKTPTIELKPDPKTGDVTVTPQRPGGGTYPPGTTVEIPGENGPITVEIGKDGSGKVPNDKLPKKDVPGTAKITEPGKPAVEVPNVTTPAKVTPATPETEKPVEIEITPQPNGDAIVTPKKPGGGTYPPGTKVEIPGENGPITVEIGKDGSGKVPNDKLPKKDVPGTGTVTEPNKKPSQPVNVTTPARKTPTIELKPDPKTGDVTVTPQRPGGGTYPPGTTVEIPGENGPITVEIGKDGSGKVPNDKLPKKDVPGTAKITEPGKPAVEVPNVTTPAKVTPATPETEKPVEIEITPQPNGDAIVTPKKPGGGTYPPGTKVEIPGENGPITVEIGKDGSGKVPNDKLPKKDVPGTGTVTEPNKKPSQPVNVTTPARKTPTIELKPDPKTGDVTVTPQRPGGGTYPPGTTVEIPGENGPITVEIGKDGSGKVPNDNLPKKDVPGTAKITEPGKPAVEVPNVTTPAKVTPATPETEKPVEIEITPQPNGDAIVTPKKPGGGTYPPGTKVEIPGENGPITVEIGKDGSGKVPNDKLPKKDVPGTGTVTEPNKKPSQPVNVTTPARKTPTIELKPDPKTGDVTVTPQRPGGGTYPPGTTVEIPGENGPITVEIGKDGSGKVPNDKLPKKDVPGTAKITEPGKPAVEVPNVTTPAKVTPATPETEKPVEIEITPQPNGDAIVTPKKPGGGTYPPGTKVEIPGENGPITVEIGKDGSGKVPNDKLPKKDVPGTGTVTEPNKKPSQPVNVTTPARKTPTIELKPDPKTGDVTVTPQRPGGGTYPPGTTVEIPGENGPITVEIGKDGSGKVPNDNLPKKDVPGTAKITEPGKPAVEVPNVTTPAKVTPATPETEKPVEIEITPQPNGDAIVTPKKPGGGTYPPGTKVEIPGENGPITVEIGKDGSGKVPNDKLPKKDVPGTGTVTEPNKKPSQPVNVTTPARKTPTIELKPDPKTGDVTVTPQRPGGGTYPPGTTVEIPGENGPITVEIGKDGSGKVPNDKLPKKDVPGTAKITEPGKPAVEVPNVTTPAKVTPATPETEKPVEIEITPQPNGDAIVTPKKPGGGTYPPGTKVEIPGENGPITVEIGKDGSGKVPNDKLPKKDVPGTGTVTEPNKKPSQPVNVTTPARKTPTIELKPDPKTGDVTVTPQRPGGGTYPPGTTVEIPGENGPITVEIGKDGSGKVPNDNLPKKDVPGTAKITEPGKPAVEVPNVTTPAKVTPATPETEKPVEIEITPQPNGDAIVTPKKPGGGTYPPGTKVEIPGENGPITVEIGKDGSGKVPNDKLPKKDVPGTGTVTEPNKKPSQPVNVTTPARKTPTIELKPDPKTGDVTVTPQRPGGGTYPPGTTVEIPGENGPITVEIGKDGSGKVPNDNLPKKDVPGTAKITEPGKPAVEVPNVTTPAKVTPATPETEKPVEIEITPQPNGDAIVTPKKPGGGTYPPGTKVEIPGENGPITVEIGKDGSGKVPNDKLPKKDVPGTGTVTEPNKKPSQPVNVTTPARKTPTIELKPDPKTGDVTVTPQRPGGGTYPPGTTVEIPGENGPITVEIGKDGSGKVPNDKLPKKDVPGTAKITEPGKPAVEVPNVTTPAKVTPATPETEKPVEIEITPQPNGDAIVTPKKPGGGTYPPGTKVEIPGENGPITVEIGKDGSGKVPNDKLPKKDVPGTGTVTEPNKKPSQPVNVTTPARKTPTIELKPDPKTGDVTVTPQRPGGGTYPPGTTVEIPGENGPITVEIGKDGSGKVPNDNLPKKDVPGTAKITEPGKPAVEVPNVTTPAKVTPATPETEKPVEIEITPQPNGDAIVTPKKPGGGTYPPGTKVEIPGENGPITVEIGKDGSGKVPNDKLPKKDVPGTGTVTEPNKKPSQPVNVTTPARKTPTIELKPDPKTGDVTVTPQRPGGGTYPPGTTVEIPGENGPITVEIGKDGSGKVPNDKLPKKDVPGTAKITEPGKPAVEVPNVTTPAKVTPATPETEKPVEIEITPQPNGDAIVTPKKPGGGTYPPGTKVEIPGENGPITVEIGKDGSGKVPNDKLPKKDVPGTGTVTEPNKKPSQPVNVTTPARKTPTIELKPDPKTGDVTVTPQRPGGGTYPPGTTVEIPGENGPITVEIGKDGSGKVPNDNLPKKDVPGTAKITEPGKPAVEVPNVTTPAKVTPATPETEKPVEIEITPQPNGDAIVTPKKPGGGTYPPGTKVEIPGENGPITVEIGKDGSGKVPNDKLPKKDVPGTGTVTEPNKKPSQPVNVTTPARKTPTIELKPDPKTGDVTVTPQRPGGGTYPPGTTVEIPGENGPITVEIGKDGSGKVPNDKLPKKDVPGTAKITEPGKPAVEVPNVTTPAKVTPATPTDTNPVAPVTPDMPVKPDTNGDSGQDKPAPATPTPNAVTPNTDQVDAKTTVDNGAKSNDSQNVLPNTGTESNATLASLGLLGMLGGLGLALAKKKED